MNKADDYHSKLFTGKVDPCYLVLVTGEMSLGLAMGDELSCIF